MTIADFSTPLAPTAGIDVNRPGIPFSRLVRVELRKLVDTRAGFWLTASIGVIAAIIMVAMLIANRSTPENLNLGEFFGLMNIPTAIILPILAILLVTGEWSQRTALTTFTLEPRRERVIGAKLIASMITAVAAVAVAWCSASSETASPPSPSPTPPPVPGGGSLLPVSSTPLRSRPSGYFSDSVSPHSS